jgi:hypothetical protein
VAQFKYLGTTATNQNLIQEEIKRRFNSGNACYHSVQNLLSSRLLSKNIKIRIYKTIILPVVLYGCETWSLTIREEHGMRVGFEVFAAVVMKSTILWEMAPCSPLSFSRRFGGTSPPSSGSKNKPSKKRAWKMVARGAFFSCSAYPSTVLVEDYFPPKRLLTFNGLHGVVSQKMALWWLQYLFLERLLPS